MDNKKLGHPIEIPKISKVFINDEEIGNISRVDIQHSIESGIQIEMSFLGVSYAASIFEKARKGIKKLCIGSPEWLMVYEDIHVVGYIGEFVAGQDIATSKIIFKG